MKNKEKGGSQKAFMNNMLPRGVKELWEYETVLTFTGQPADTNTVVLGAKTYTFQTTLTDVDGNVLIGPSAAISIDNLIEF